MEKYSLRDVPVGGMARVIGFKDIRKSYRAKLLSMGLTRGTPLLVEGVAPFGDPVHVSIRGFSLSLRRDEADGLMLERITGEPESFGFRRPRYATGRRRRRRERRGLRRGCCGAEEDLQ